MTAFVVLAVDAVEIGRVVVVPDAHLVRAELFGDFVDGIRGLLHEVARFVDLSRERPDDQVAIANRLIELDRCGELVALQFVEAVVESARLELRGVEVRPPLGARFAERVLELDGVEPDRRECVERTGNLGGELLPDTPELRADRDLFPLGSCGGRKEESGRRGGAADSENVSTGRMRVHAGILSGSAHPMLESGVELGTRFPSC